MGSRVARMIRTLQAIRSLVMGSLSGGEGVVIAVMFGVQFKGWRWANDHGFLKAEKRTYQSGVQPNDPS